MSTQQRPTSPPPPGEPQEQNFFDRTRFAGRLSGHGSSVDLGFYARIDGVGLLHLELDRMPESPEAHALHIDQRPGSPVDLLDLSGVSETGQKFSSDSFSISRYYHGSEPGQEIDIQGDCYDAELELPPEKVRGYDHDIRSWRVRQLSTFRRLAHETPLGRVVIGGPRQDQESQDPNAFIAIHRPKDDTREDWWTESERLVTHVARVLSFASDTYLRPLIEQRVDKGRVIVRVASQGRASPPYMAPFRDFHLQSVLACACDRYFDRHDDIDKLDAAIRWLTAPVAYDESRLINAMSALENILAGCGLEDIETFLGNADFKKLASAIRAVLKEANAPAGMIPKVAELNRRALGEKVEALIQARSIVTDDFPEGWLDTIIKQRNIIVHTGVSPDLGDVGPDTIDYTIWAREIVIRIILERLGYAGAFRSWLHHDEQLHFPECVPMEQWVRIQEAISARGV